MKYSGNFREIARDSLSGQWAVATLSSFFVLLIGAGIATNGTVTSIISNTGSKSFGSVQVKKDATLKVTDIAGWAGIC